MPPQPRGDISLSALSHGVTWISRLWRFGGPGRGGEGQALGTWQWRACPRRMFNAGPQSGLASPGPAPERETDEGRLQGPLEGCLPLRGWWDRLGRRKGEGRGGGSGPSVLPEEGPVHTAQSSPLGALFSVMDSPSCPFSLRALPRAQTEGGRDRKNEPKWVMGSVLLSSPFFFLVFSLLFCLFYVFFFFFLFKNFSFSFCCFWLHHTACGILVPQPGLELGPSAVSVQSPNHWTPREFPVLCSL